MQILIRLVGTFQMCDDAGRDLAPRGGKARAILAMLALTPDRRRSRRWLEAHLWSDRAPEQAMASLRQALSEIRKAMEPLGDYLKTDRESVSIPILEIDQDDEAGSLQAGREFLEGLDINDQAFEEWLREERARKMIASSQDQRIAAQPATRLVLTLEPRHGDDRTERFLSHALACAISQLISEFVEIDTYMITSERSVIDLPNQGFALTVDTLAKPGVTHLLVGLSEPATGRTFWSRRTSLKGDETDIIAGEDVPEIIFRAADAVCGSLSGFSQRGSSALRASVLTTRSVRAMFSFETAALRSADHMLTEALALYPNPRSFAWLAHLRQVMAIERVEADWQRMRCEADEFACKALEFQTENPLVLALVSQIRVMLDGDPDIGISLARDALQASPHNPFCYSAISGAQLRVNRPDKALLAACQGIAIAGQSPLGSWWHSLAGLASMAMGKHDMARVYFETALARTPCFRTPLRCLYFLYLADCQPEKAERVMTRLTGIEPDFSLDQLRDDPDYPAATLRRSGLITALRRSSAARPS